MEIQKIHVPNHQPVFNDFPMNTSIYREFFSQPRLIAEGSPSTPARPSNDHLRKGRKGWGPRKRARVQLP